MILRIDVRRRRWYWICISHALMEELNHREHVGKIISAIQQSWFFSATFILSQLFRTWCCLVIFTVLHGTGQVHSPVHAALGVQHTTGPHMTFRVRARVRVRRRFVTMVRIKAPAPILCSGAETNHPTDVTWPQCWEVCYWLLANSKPHIRLHYVPHWHNTSPHATRDRHQQVRYQVCAHPCRWLNLTCVVTYGLMFLLSSST